MHSDPQLPLSREAGPARHRPMATEASVRHDVSSQQRAVRTSSRLRRAGSPPGAAARSQGLNGQTKVLQLANVVLGLSPMNSVADQMAPVGSANEAL